jgi:trimeric autotransporter adhesin
MAACTFRVGTADTGATPNTSGAFTPALNDLLVVFVIASGSVGIGDSLTSSAGITFARAANVLFNASANSVYAYIANSFVTAGQAVSQTLTWNNTDAATGTIIFCFSVSGMSLSGSAAVRQQINVANSGAGGLPPGASFGVNALTTNPIIGCVGNGSSPAGLTPGTGRTEPAGGDIGYSTPTTGGAVQFQDSGNTSTGFPWGSNSATAFGAVVLELDASAPAPVVSDTASAAETRTLEGGTSVADTATAADTATVEMQTAASIADTASAVETQSLAGGTTKADTASAAETQALEAATTKADTAAAAETQTIVASVTINDTANAADSVSLGGAITQADPATANETQSFIGGSTVVDAAAAVETQSEAGAVVQADTAVAAETQSLAGQTSLPDTATAVDTNDPQPSGSTINVTINDTATAVDSQQIGAGVTIVDTANGADGQALAGATTKADTASAIDEFLGHAEFSAVDDTAVAGDSNSVNIGVEDYVLTPPLSMILDPGERHAVLDADERSAVLDLNETTMVLDHG